jgi:predicted CoA-binding protein
MDWRENIIDDGEGISDVLRSARRVAVVGIKPESHGARPAHYVPAYLQSAGYQVVPVPVYYPDVTEILGQPVHRTVAEISDPVDLVVLFRRGPDVARHVEDIIEARPAAVWMQSGIRNEDAARRFAEAGIRVVQDRCSMVEHRALR